MFTTDVHYLAVFACTLLYAVLGFTWYSPKVFGPTWLQCVGRKMEDCKGCSAKCWIGSLIIGFIISFVLTLFVYASHASAAWQGATVGFFAWLGFVAPTQYGQTLYEGKPLKLFFITTGFMFIFLLVAGVILAVWQ